MHGHQILDLLTDNFCFDELSSAELDALCSHARLRTYGHDEVIFQKGDLTTDLMAVISGQVRICSVSEDGRQVILNTIRSGEIFGEIGVLDGDVRTADAVSNVVSKLLIIDRQSFMNVLRGNSNFCIGLLELLCSRIRRTSEQAEDLVLLDLEKRLAKKLLSLCDRQRAGRSLEETITIRLSQENLATMTGASRVSVNKHLGIWANDGLIALRRNQIVMLDEAGMRLIFGPGD